MQTHCVGLSDLPFQIGKAIEYKRYGWPTTEGKPLMHSSIIRKEEAEQKLAEVLAMLNVKRTVNELVDLVGSHRSTVNKQMKILLERGAIKRTRTNCEYVYWKA
jgi:hypothetical protein